MRHQQPWPSVLSALAIHTIPQSGKCRAKAVLNKAPESTGAAKINTCMQLEPNCAYCVYILLLVSHRGQVCCDHDAASEACKTFFFFFSMGLAIWDLPKINCSNWCWMQVVISPHVYGPSISQTTKNAAGQALWTRLSQSFGYLNKVGFGGHVFPIAIGEFGTYFAEQADQTMFADLAKYMLNKKDDGSPVDDLHNPITSFFWFAWNANSGDTGGLVNSPNWDSIVWQKIEYLQRLGLAPWYTGEPPSTSVAGAATPSTPPVPSGPNPPSSPSSGPASPATPSTPSPPMQTPCIVAASFTSVWQDPNNGPYMTAVSLIITNIGSQTLPVPWSLTISSTAYTNVQYSWNWEITSGYDGRTVSGVANQEWLAMVPGGKGRNGVNLGYVAGSSQSTTFIPDSISVNSQKCEWA